MMISFFGKISERLGCLLGYLQHPFLLAIRLYWGWHFFMTGKGKLWNIDPVIGFFTDLGIPHPVFNAYLVGYVECFGGLFLMLGLASRFVAIPLTINMTVAYLTAHIESVRNLFKDPDTFFQQDPFLFLYATLIVLIFGPGFFSVDRLLKSYQKKRSLFS